MSGESDSRERREECHKLLAARERGGSQIIGEFLEWLREKEIVFCRYEDDVEAYFPIRERTEQLLAAFFGVNLNEVEKERRSMLQDLRDGHDWESSK